MALKDIEAFVRERLLIWDPDADVSAGSPLDSDVIQPLLARIGSDPFSTNLPLFVRETLVRKFPNLAISDIDELSDLLAKPFELLLAPVVRETNRIALSQSFEDPSLLTRDEAQALGANFFSTIEDGNPARGVLRIYFSSPRSLTVGPANYGYTKTGLVFPPESTQSIRADEMLLNLEGSEYYFDVNLVAESPGDQYNIEPNSFIGIADVPGVVRVTNKYRFRSGTPAESAVEYVGRLEQEQAEKSMVTARGIVTKVFKAFPEINRIAVVGMRDEEMLRDVLRGGGYGPILATGTLLEATPDGQNGTYTSAIRVNDPVDFTVLIGPPGPVPAHFALTIYGAFASGDPVLQDVQVTHVIDSVTLRLAEMNILGSASNKPWALRRESLTLSGIPGGILFPNTVDGELEIPDNEVHIGGATDVYVKGTSTDQASLVLDNVSDDEPGLEGSAAYIQTIVSTTVLVLSDYTFYDRAVGNEAESNYQLLDGDPIYEFLKNCPRNRYLVRLMHPALVAGTYRVIRVWQTPSYNINQHPMLELDSFPVSAYGWESGGEVINPITWKIQDDLDIDLVEPKETRWEAADLRTVVGSDLVTSADGTDFSSLGVGAGDTLEILNGTDAGTYTVSGTTGAGNSQIQLTQSLTKTASNLSYIVYRANQAGGLDLPLVRVTSIDLLDSSGQPVGNEIPYGKPVYCRSGNFSNYARGTKLEVRDACVGCVGAIQPLNPGNIPVVVGIASKSIKITWRVYGTLDVSGFVDKLIINFPAGTLTLQQVVDKINTDLVAHAGAQIRAAYIVQGRRLGIAPIGPETEIWDTNPTDPNSGYKKLFGTYTTTYLRWTPPITSRDIRSDEVSGPVVDPNRDDGWDDDSYDIDRDVDGVDLRSGWQSGHYSMVPRWDMTSTTALESCVMLTQDLRPESDVHVVVGSRSIGLMRVFFQDPVTIEFGEATRFTVTSEVAGEMEFFPDPTISATRIPPPPDTEEPKDAIFTTVSGPSNTSTGRMSSASTDFVGEGVTVGDRVVVRYETVYGGVLPADLLNFAGKELLISYDNSPDIAVVFEATDLVGIVPRTSRDDVATQINDALGVEIASIEVTTHGDTLTFMADVPLVIRYSNESNAANTTLGIATSADQSNEARMAGNYIVTDVVDEDTLSLQRIEGTISWTNNDGSVPPNRIIPQHFSVIRPGAQRISSTVMATQPTSFGLYYVDLEVCSRGVGDLWNIDAGIEARVSGYLSYGYHLTADESLSYSMSERPMLRLPPVIFPVGATDSVTSALDVVGQNVQISYERSSLVSNAQSFVLEELERVTNSSMLVRHLLPHYVKLYVEYEGGSKTEYVQRDLEAYIGKLYPNQYLQSNDIQRLISKRGATYIANPLELVALVHGLDREIWAQWSTDRINTNGRLAAFMVDSIELLRRG